VVHVVCQHTVLWCIVPVYWDNINIYPAISTFAVQICCSRFKFQFSLFNTILLNTLRILCLFCNVKKVGKLVRFKQKGQKQASFLAFHKCCQGCLLCGPRYISTSFITVLWCIVPVYWDNINIYPAISTFAVQICYTNK
jgi:hypothetical protein